MSGARLVPCFLLAVVFTLLIVNYSLTHGRLIYPPTYDDVGYFERGQRTLNELGRGGVAGLAAYLVRDPPHSPFSIPLATVSLALLGPHDWAPYVGNVVVIFVFLVFVGYLLGELAAWQRVLGLVLALTPPFVGLTVHEFRPDLPVGCVTAMTMILVVEQSLVDAGPGRRWLIGACFAATLLIKPTFFPLSLLLVTLALMLSVVRDLAGRPLQLGFSSLTRRWLGPFVIGGLVALPYYVMAGKGIARYIWDNAVGRFRAIWIDPAAARGWAEQLGFYLTGPGGATALGYHLFIMGAIILGGFALVVLRGTGQERGMGGALLFLTLAAYAIPTAGPLKHFFMAPTFYYLVTFEAMWTLGLLSRAARAAPPGSARPGLRLVSLLVLPAALLSGVACARFPGAWGHRADPDVVARNQAVASVYETVRDNARLPARVFVDMLGIANPVLFQYMADKDGKEALDFDAGNANIFLEGELDAVARKLDEVDVVIAGGECGPPQSRIPLMRLCAQTLDLIRAREEFRLLRVVPAPGTPYYVFKRPGRFEGYEELGGIGEVEGPYPQWGLPAVRWGLGPRTRLRVTAPPGAGRKLSMSAQAQLADQEMTVRVDGLPVLHHRFEEVGRFYDLEIPLGAHTESPVIELDYGRALAGGLERQRLAVLFRVLRVTPE